MDAAKARNFHFRQEAGSSSVRFTQRGYGGKGMVGGEPLFIRPSLREQYEILKRRAVEIDQILDIDLPAQEREKLRSELAELMRSTGDMRRTLQEGSRLAFEKIFVHVANARLPRDHFLVIVEEAREIWRSKGYADLVPPPTNQMRRKISKHALKLSQRGG